MTGYQQAVIFLNGSKADERFAVRNVERHYIDAIAPLFQRSSAYFQERNEAGKRGYWVLKSRQLSIPKLSEVEDWQGFCRGVIELQGVLDVTQNKRGGVRPRLRIYGQPDLLTALMAVLPAKEKKIQNVRTQTGTTYAIYYQSAAEIRRILDYIDGSPRNERLWAEWDGSLTKGEK